MIFIVLLVIVFGFVISAMQFGSAPDGGNVTTATPRAQVYAVNMETWHQAAMLAAQADATDIANDAADCPNAGQACAIPLNQIFWNYGPPSVAYQSTSPGTPLTHQPSLANNWPEYVPVVSETATTGWQSFLIRNINGTNAAAATGTDSYVLTVFMGFGGCTGANCTNAISSNPGGLNNAQIATALAKTIQDRMGVGNLQCSNNVCSFTRAAAYTPPGVAQPTMSDLPLQFPSTLTTLAGVTSGMPAIMTRVSSIATIPPGNCPAAGYEFDTSGNGKWVTNKQFTATTLDPNFYCAVNFSSTTAPSGPNAISPAIAASGYSVTSDAGPPATTANCLSPSNTWQTTAPANLPTCSNGDGGGAKCSAQVISSPAGCTAHFPQSPPGIYSEPNEDPRYLGQVNATCSATGIWIVGGGRCTYAVNP